MQLISKINIQIRFLLFVIYVFSKYAWIIPLKDEKAIPIANAFQKILDESKCKLNKIWVDKASEFYNNRSMKTFLQNNNIEMHWTHNKEKGKKNKENNEEGPKFKFGGNSRISKYKNIFAQGYVPNWSEEDSVIKKVKDTVPWKYVISDLNGGETVATFYEKELQKTNQKEFKVEKVIKKKDDKLYVKWKGYDSSFISWIDKKDII